jgi:hypothetical protein
VLRRPSSHAPGCGTTIGPRPSMPGRRPGGAPAVEQAMKPGT